MPKGHPSQETWKPCHTTFPAAWLSLCMTPPLKPSLAPYYLHRDIALLREISQTSPMKPAIHLGSSQTQFIWSRALSPSCSDLMIFLNSHPHISRSHSTFKATLYMKLKSHPFKCINIYQPDPEEGSTSNLIARVTSQSLISTASLLSIAVNCPKPQFSYV